VSRVKPAVVRFYVDADILGLAKILASLRADVTYPGDPGDVIRKRKRPACAITPDTDDVDWLPVIAAQGWLIITRDAQIQEHRAEIQSVLENGAKMVALAGKDARGTWEQLEVVMTRWRDVERLSSLPGPFVYSLFRTTLTKVA
jgi:hypothetical protein